MYTTTQTSAAQARGVEILQSRKACTAAEPTKFVKRIGSTRFIVTVRFSESETETLNDKILRLIGNEVQNV
jgi:hypothetical protein